MDCFVLRFFVALEVFVGFGGTALEDGLQVALYLQFVSLQVTLDLEGGHWQHATLPMHFFRDHYKAMVGEWRGNNTEGRRAGETGCVGRVRGCTAVTIAWVGLHGVFPPMQFPRLLATERIRLSGQSPT